MEQENKLILRWRATIHGDEIAENNLACMPGSCGNVSIFAAENCTVTRFTSKFITIANKLVLSDNDNFCLLFIPKGSVPISPQVIDNGQEYLYVSTNRLFEKIHMGQPLGVVFVIPRINVCIQHTGW